VLVQLILRPFSKDAKSISIHLIFDRSRIYCSDCIFIHSFILIQAARPIKAHTAKQLLQQFPSFGRIQSIGRGTIMMHD